MPKEREIKQLVIEYEGGKIVLQLNEWSPTDKDIEDLRDLATKLTKKILKKSNNTYITYREK